MEYFVFYATLFLCVFTYFCYVFTNDKNKIIEDFIDIKHDDMLVGESLCLKQPIESCFHELKSKNPRWISPGEEITIAGKIITNGKFYYGNKLNYSCCNSLESSLIDDNLNIATENKNYTDHSADFYPKFSLLSPKCRGSYIDWLASDRIDTNIPVCYLLIYFNGLEHRVIADYADNLVSDAEYQDIFTELEYLRVIHKSHKIFYNKTTKLMEWMAINRSDIITMPKTNLSLIKNSLFFKYELAEAANKLQPISHDLALAWLWQSDHYKFNNKILEHYKIFENVFKLQYRKKFQQGILIKPSTKTLQLRYKEFDGQVHSMPFNRPILAGTRSKTQLKQIASLADKCIDFILNESHSSSKDNGIMVI